VARTLTDEQIAQLAADHEQARLTATSIDPVSRRYPDVTLEDAYAIQAAWVALQVESGSVVRGKKIGLTSRAMQQAMKIDEPDYGILFDYMFIPNGGSLAVANHVDPKIEVELAFVLKNDLAGAEVTADDVYDATDHVVAALELIDARSYRVHPDDGVSRTVRDTIADNAANAGIVVGDVKVPVDEVRNGELRWAGAICSRNGVVEETGVAAGVLGDPVQGIVWLARRLHGLGIPLQEGETVLAGSFTRPLDCRVGDEFHVDFASPALNLGVITLSVE
jgi:2-oxo-hept-3-ene-1,7-dioate hydratase